VQNSEANPEAPVVESEFASSPQSLERVLRVFAPLRPSFIYERLSTRTRAPERTTIGFGQEWRPESTHPDEPFEAIRRRVAAGRGSPSEGPRGVLAFLSYEALVGDGPVRDEHAPTPYSLLIQPSAIVELDHQAGVARLTGPWPHAASLMKDAFTKTREDIVEKPTNIAPDEGVEAWRAVSTEEEFADSARSLQREIRQREDVVGVALSVQLERTAAIDPLDAYLILRRINPSTCMFFAEEGDFALWGATSLPIMRVSDRQITAETDGATRPAPSGAADAWIPTAKENEEYDLVVAALREDLSGVIQPESLVFTADREPRQYFNLRHLFAEVTARLAEGVDAVAALRALTPHGAATGFSKRGAIDLIRAHDARPRGPYAGAIGFFRHDGSADAACVIRSAWKSGNVVRTRAGAKIVSGSDPAAEYRESVSKTLPLRRVVGQLVAS
jgi:anthranilate synthase component 1